MKIKCLKDVHDGSSLKKDKIYEAKLSQKGWFAVTDESGDEYAYPPDIFEIPEEESLVFSLIKDRLPAKNPPQEILQAQATEDCITGRKR